METSANIKLLAMTVTGWPSISTIDDNYLFLLGLDVTVRGWQDFQIKILTVLIATASMTVIPSARIYRSEEKVVRETNPKHTRSPELYTDVSVYGPTMRISSCARHSPVQKMFQLYSSNGTFDAVSSSTIHSFILAPGFRRRLSQTKTDDYSEPQDTVDDIDVYYSTPDVNVPNTSINSR